MRTVLHDEVDDVRRSDGASHVEGRILAHTHQMVNFERWLTNFCEEDLKIRFICRFQRALGSEQLGIAIGVDTWVFSSPKKTERACLFASK